MISSTINSKDSKKKNFLKENKIRLKLIQQRNAKIKEKIQLEKETKKIKKIVKQFVPKQPQERVTEVIVEEPIQIVPQVEKTFKEFGVQITEIHFTNEGFMSSGKMLLPSAYIVAAIDEERELKRKKQHDADLLEKASKKFDGHSIHLESHLSNLREFLESGSVSSRRKAKELEDSFDIDEIFTSSEAQNKISSSDLLPYETDFEDDLLDDDGGTTRIKQKKQELLQLIDEL